LLQANTGQRTGTTPTRLREWLPTGRREFVARRKGVEVPHAANTASGDPPRLEITVERRTSDFDDPKVPAPLKKVITRVIPEHATALVASTNPTSRGKPLDAS
jgi:hypothetical protein